jgi:hypothetical protein
MNAIKIQGRDYIPVNERIIEFRKLFPEWSMITEILPSSDGTIRFKASIVDDKGIVRATGHAEEKEGSSFINKTSYVENCETSAWGRCLANWGIGVENACASADEIANAIVQKDDPIDRQPRQYDDGREWLSEQQLLKIIDRYNAGETDVVEKALQTFKISKAYRQRLADLQSSLMSS